MPLDFKVCDRLAFTEGLRQPSWLKASPVASAVSEFRFIDRKPARAAPPISAPFAWQMTDQEVQDYQAAIEVASAVGGGKRALYPGAKP